MKSRFVKLLGLIFTGTVLWLSGCGQNPELDTYKSNMNQFFENIAYYDGAINAIDAASETAGEELLSYLDGMALTFSQLADLPVPDNFPGVEELADQAHTYMAEAVSLYHRAFESEPFDENLAAAAKENYDRASLRLGYIVTILQGGDAEEIFVEEESEGTEG